MLTLKKAGTFLALLALALNLLLWTGPGRPPRADAQGVLGQGIYPAGAVYNLAAPGANTNIFTTSITPKQQPSLYRITVILAVTSVFNMTVTDGTTPFTFALNNGTALTALQPYVITYGTRQLNSAGTKTFSYNFQVATNGVIDVLNVDELIGQ